VRSLRRAGFFREVRHGDPQGPSLTDLARPAAPPNEDRVVAYLRSGEVIASTSVVVDDVLNPSRRGIAVLEIATDGVWAWPTDLTHYVQSYHVSLPEDFALHMERHGWAAPRLSEAKIARASVALKSGDTEE